MKRYKIEKKDEGKMIDVDKILKDKFKEIISEDNPEFTQKDIKNIQMPEICIMTFLEINSNILLYYVSQKIKGIPYELIYFLEEKGDEDKKKSYFKENYFWYQYQSNDESRHPKREAPTLQLWTTCPLASHAELKGKDVCTDRDVSELFVSRNRY